MLRLMFSVRPVPATAGRHVMLVVVTHDVVWHWVPAIPIVGQGSDTPKLDPSRVSVTPRLVGAFKAWLVLITGVSKEK